MPIKRHRNSLPVISYKLISYLWIQVFSLVNHLLNFSHNWSTTADMTSLVNFGELWLQILCQTMTEFLYSVNTSNLKQFCKLVQKSVGSSTCSCSVSPSVPQPTKLTLIQKTNAQPKTLFTCSNLIKLFFLNTTPLDTSFYTLNAL